MKTSRKYTTYIPAVLVVMAVTGLAVWAGHLGWHAYQLSRLASEAQQLAQEGIDGLEPLQVQELVRRLDAHLSAIDSDLTTVYPLLHLASSLPGVGKYAGQVQPWVQYTRSLAQAGDILLATLAPLWSQDSSDPDAGSSSQRLFTALQSGKPRLEAASRALERANRARIQIDPLLLPERFRPLFLRLDESFPLIQGSVSLLSSAQGLMGADQPATYLLLAQNSDELRATGGFISGIGTIQLEQGRIGEFQMGDSYSVDDFSKHYPLPPEPLQRLMLAGYWVVRDANWSPDFPTAAQQVQSLYKLSTGTETQGVIAFDQVAVRDLIGVTGPITLPEIAEPVSAKNVETFMQQSWEPEPGTKPTGEWWRGRKDFMGILGKVLLNRILQPGEPKVFLKLGRVVLDLVDTGHLQVYFDSPKAQEQLLEAGLAHSLGPAGGDYLMLVDSNVGFNKADALIQREINYSLDLSDPENPLAELVLKYTHTGRPGVACMHASTYGSGTYDDLQERCYWDYWRVYFPGGSALLDAQVKPVPGEQLLSGEGWPGIVEVYPGENGSEVLAGVMVLPAGGEEELRLTASMPSKVLVKDASGSWHYYLKFLKQPGVRNLVLKLVVKMPDGYILTQDSPGGSITDSDTWTWSDTIDRDQDIELVIAPLSNNNP